MTAIQDEIAQITNELQDVADQLVNLEDDGSDEDAGDTGNDTTDDENRDGSEEGEGQSGSDDEERSATPEQRSAALAAIKSGLSTRNAKSTKAREKEMRSAFANYIVGNIDDTEARSLGLVSGNGSVTVPDFMAKEIITYAQEENFLRRLGTRVTTKENIKYPILVKQAEAQGHKTERTSDMPETDIEFDEIELSPTEFDALATVTKSCLHVLDYQLNKL